MHCSQVMKEAFDDDETKNVEKSLHILGMTYTSNRTINCSIFEVFVTTSPSMRTISTPSLPVVKKKKPNHVVCCTATIQEQLADISIFFFVHTFLRS